MVGGISSCGGPATKLRMNWFEVFRASREPMLCRAGPNTSGGRIVDNVNEGFSFSMKSHAALSANVLLAAQLW